MGARLEIHYCPRCRWLLRASWLAQELLSTFETDLGEAGGNFVLGEPCRFWRYMIAGGRPV